MGFNTSASTINLIAKLTPLGRKKIITNDNLLITSFGLGDSDANYRSLMPLPSGFVPTAGGDIGASTFPTNSVSNKTELRSRLLLNNTGLLTKPVEVQSNEIITETKVFDKVSVSGTSLTHNKVVRNVDSDPLTNLFYSFGLPVTEADFINFSATTNALGGFSDTALSGLTASTMLVIGIKNNSFGESIDGKTIKVSLNTVNGAYSIYGTYENKGNQIDTEDLNISETSISSKQIGTNIAYLFCDAIKKPNNNAALSWATGNNTFKPFSQNSKQLFNMVSDSNQGQVVDSCVGVAYLDKGFIVITNPFIAENFFPISHSATTVVSFNSVSTVVSQSITCLANRGEFSISTNKTFDFSDVPRISEVALYDGDGDMIALAKTDRHVSKSINEFIAFGINITL